MAMSGGLLVLRSEVFEAPRPQIPNPILFRNANSAALIVNFANAGDCYTVHSLWQSRHVLGPDAEQQLEILAAMKGQHQRIKRAAAAERFDIVIDGNRSGLN